ncbi:MAG: hypothetical protein IT256_07385 [Chitinophagaceae bacterium]|nr:hypothetical protein [Chitinophagaceae bacterium]
MRYLLPHCFKKTGLYITPIGFIIWVLMQYGYVTKLLTHIFGQDNPPTNYVEYYWQNVFIAVISFLSFLFGLYFIAFSKEKIEDEMVQKTRMESFQFAAVLQLLLFIVGFVAMLILGEPEGDGILGFMVLSVLVFWLAFVTRFHYKISRP